MSLHTLAGAIQRVSDVRRQRSAAFVDNEKT